MGVFTFGGRTGSVTGQFCTLPQRIPVSRKARPYSAVRTNMASRLKNAKKPAIADGLSGESGVELHVG